MRTLYLLRHAKSAWDEPSLHDHDRPLAPRGRRAAATMAKYLAQRKGGPPNLDLILCSTACRARQTLERVLPAWSKPPAVEFHRELYLCGADTLLHWLRALPDEIRSILLVAHNPDLQELACSLAGDGPPDRLRRLEEKLPTGAFVTLELPDGRGWDVLEPGAATLVEFVTPRELEGSIHT